MSASPHFGAFARTPGAGRRALQACVFDALLSGAARLRADRVALEASGAGVVGPPSLTFGAFDGVASRLAGAFRECGLAPGDRLMIAGAADPATVALIFGAARAGLETALISAAADRDALIAAARAADVAALAAPGRIGDWSPAQTLLEVAGAVETIRFVGVWGAAARGALRLDDDSFEAPATAAKAPPAAIVSFAGAPATPRPVRRDQSTVAAAALDFLARAQIGAGLALVSCVSPTRLAGLVAGPVASLLSGATLHLHAPFEGAALIEALRDTQPAHLILPGSLGAEIAALARLRRLRLASLTLVEDEAGAPAVIDADSPIVDLRRIGEIACAAERRDEHGRAAAFPGAPHTVPLDEEDLLALDWREAADGVREWRGVAVAGGEDWTRA